MRRTRLLLVVLAGLIAIVLLTVVSNYLGGSSGEGPRPEAEEPRMRNPMGRVRTAAGTPPPPGTRVVALGPSTPAETVADAHGDFRFDPIPPGTWGFEAVAGPLRCRATQIGSGVVELTLPGRFTASGRVVGARSGEPVEDAEVWCGARKGVTDERGRFRLEGIAAPDGIPPEIEVQRPGGETQLLDPGPDAAWDDLFLRVD